MRNSSLKSQSSSLQRKMWIFSSWTGHSMMCRAWRWSIMRTLSSVTAFWCWVATTVWSWHQFYLFFIFTENTDQCSECLSDQSTRFQAAPGSSETGSDPDGWATSCVWWRICTKGRLTILSKHSHKKSPNSACCICKPITKLSSFHGITPPPKKKYQLLNWFILNLWHHWQTGYLVLQLAVYTRCELNIRTTGNFLLAFASYNKSCRPYLRKYFCAAVALPSDWIDVAEQYQVCGSHFHGKETEEQVSIICIHVVTTFSLFGAFMTFQKILIVAGR